MSTDFGITRIHHHSVIVTDARAARGFYARTLGLKEVPSPSTFTFPVLWFALGDQQLHLMIKDKPDPDSPRHVALGVRDAAAARTALKAKGVRIEETVEIPGADRFFVRDPDGNRIELIEWKVPWGEGPM